MAQRMNGRRVGVMPRIEDGGSSETSDNIKVMIRVRPENSREQNARNAKIIVRPVNEHVVVFDPRDSRSQKSTAGIKRTNRDLKFAFDHVFGPEDNNKHVYEQTTKAVLDGLLNGYNCSVLAYGATGAGKTHTMVGEQAQPGVMYLTVVDLFDRMRAIRNDKTCQIFVSYLEVYNEQIKDLLAPGKPLPLREDPKLGIVATGLVWKKPQSAEELLDMLKSGNGNRTQHPTDANAESSRSHAVLQVTVHQKDRTANLSAELKVAKLCMVDLAGSERACVSHNTGRRAQEGANINRSLLALGNLINALAEKKGQKFVSYRGSKLTRLLKDSLGGNCRTVMIALISPSSLSYEETYNTLKYADRAKQIKTELKRNVLSVDFHVMQYKTIVNDLREEVAQLKAKLKEHEETIPAQVMVDDDKHLRVRQQLHGVFGERLGVRREQLELESAERKLTWSLRNREKSSSRFSLLNQIEPSVEEVQQEAAARRREMEALAKQKTAAAARLEENNQRLERIQAEVKTTSGEPLPGVVAECLQGYHLEVNLADAQCHIQHLCNIVQKMEHEAQISNKVITYLLKMQKYQDQVLKQAAITMPPSEELAQELREAWMLASKSPDASLRSRIASLVDLATLPFSTQHGVTPARQTTVMMPQLPSTTQSPASGPAQPTQEASGPSRPADRRVRKVTFKDSPTTVKRQAPKRKVSDGCSLVRDSIHGSHPKGTHGTPRSAQGRATASMCPSRVPSSEAASPSTPEENEDSGSQRADSSSAGLVPLSKRLAPQSAWDVLSHPASAMTQAVTLEDIAEENEDTGRGSGDSFVLSTLKLDDSSSQSPGLNETFTLDPDSPSLVSSLPIVDSSQHAPDAQRDSASKCCARLSASHPGPSRSATSADSSTKKRSVPKTVPKEQACNTPGGSCKTSPANSRRKTQVSRSIDFGTADKTPERVGSSLADLLNTPTPLRQPLRILNPNTPGSSSAGPVRLSRKFDAKESTSPFPYTLPRRIRTPKRSPSTGRCNRIASDSRHTFLSARTRQSLSRLLKRKTPPCTSEGSSPKVARPSYMQMTKAALRRQQQEGGEASSMGGAKRILSKPRKRALVRSQSMPRLKGVWQI